MPVQSQESGHCNDNTLGQSAEMATFAGW
jgi:hypothetical protein